MALIYIVYQIKGMMWYFTFLQYSSYPSSEFFKNFSSSNALKAITKTSNKEMSIPHHEPSAGGVNKSITDAPRYIGCLTIA